jgi:membrane-associated protein
MNNFDWKNLIDPLFYIHFDVNGIKAYISFYLSFCRNRSFADFLPGDSLCFLRIYNRELIENIVFIDSDFINVILLQLSGYRFLGILLVIGLERKVVIIYTIKKTLLVQEKIPSAV